MPSTGNVNALLSALVGFGCLIFSFSTFAVQTRQFQTLKVIPSDTTHYGGFYSSDRIRLIRQWATETEEGRRASQDVVSKSEYWVSKPDAEVWHMVPSQVLPRTIDVTFDRTVEDSKFLGCLVCGDEIKQFGNYPYEPDVSQQQWKITCPSCGATFPTNDFLAFYQSGIDTNGEFTRTKADTSLLFNVLHPLPDDPLHTYGVDDGWGYQDSTGRSYRFIAYYAWKHWQFLVDAIALLADAYLYTGNLDYAKKAGILLDRIADVYPEMDWEPLALAGYYHSDGGRFVGKIGGSIYETQIIRSLADSYDKLKSGLFVSEELHQFLAERAHNFTLAKQKGTAVDLLKNIDQGIMLTALEAIRTKVIRGNQGMHQLAAINAAIALNDVNETAKWLDWVFDSDGGEMHKVIISELDRDGLSDEGGVGYALMLGKLILEMAVRIDGYPHYSKDLFEEYPKFRNSFSSAFKLALFGEAIPNIGDSGGTGLINNKALDARFFAKGFHYTGDTLLAIAAYVANDGLTDGLLDDLFIPDSQKVIDQIEAIGYSNLGFRMGSRLMGGFGLGLLESKPAKVGVAINYGRSTKHGHFDLLNFDLYAYGQWLMPDHGYPEFATQWPSRNEWTKNTISHNTVVVDGKPQQPAYGGKTKLFEKFDGFSIISVDGSAGYPELNRYQRTLALIDAGSAAAYLVDFFDVEGGNEHLYSLHTLPGVIGGNLKLGSIQQGTYAGENVRKASSSTDLPLGYSYLYNVRSVDSNGEDRLLTWRPKDEGLQNVNTIGLDIHLLNNADEMVLAKGDPPSNKPGNPTHLEYLLQVRRDPTSALSSKFITVMEPRNETSEILQIKRISEENSPYLAIKIRLKDGFEDYLIINHVNTSIIEIEDEHIILNGTIGFIRTYQGSVHIARLIEGKELIWKDIQITNTHAYHEGNVSSMNQSLTGGGWIEVPDRLYHKDVSGKRIYIETEGPIDTTYLIRSAAPNDSGGTILYLDPPNFVAGIEEVDGEERYRYDFGIGDKYKIHFSKEYIK